jgi:hypothetical protein
MASNLSANTKLIAVMILLAALSRIIPHPNNVAPLAGMALFGAYYFKKNWHALLVTLASWWLSDLALNNTVYKAFYPTFTWLSTTYITVAISLVIIHFFSKKTLKNTSTFSLVSSSLLASIVFFVVTNFGSFLDLYPQNMAGLLAAYIKGLPFLGYTILGDLVYTFALFGMYQFVLAKSKYKLA